MPTLTELRDLLSAFETAGDADRVQRHVLDPNERSVHQQRRLVPAVAAAAVVLAIAVGATILTYRGVDAPRQVIGPGAAVHPGLDELTKTCIDETEVIRTWGAGPSAGDGYSGLAYTKHDGTQCTYEAENILSTHPAAGTATRVSGMTVYLVPTSAGIRTGYVPFTAGQVTAYLKSAHKTPDHSLRLYRLVSIAADNPERVLVTILEQTRTLYPSK